MADEVRANGSANRGAVVYLVRHASAESRAAWDAPDAERPLTRRGLVQAAAIAAVLVESAGAWRPDRIVSSPARRCIETVEPAAAAAGLAVEELPELAEGRSGRGALELFARLVAADGPGHAIIACSHGDVIDEVLASFAALEVDVEGPLIAPKAATWRLVLIGGELRSASYVPPPA